MLKKAAFVLLGVILSTGRITGQPVEAAQAQAAPRTDLYDDPLPPGALARLGSVRLRHAGLSDSVFLGDGKTILSAGNDRVLRFWDASSGRQLRAVKLQSTAGPGRMVTLSPDGKMLAAQEKDEVILWEVDTGREVKRRPSKVGIGFLYFSPDSKILAIGGYHRSVIFWEWAADRLRVIDMPRNGGRGVEFSPDSTFHGSFSPDGKWFTTGAWSLDPVKVIEVATGREVKRFDARASTSALAPDGKQLAVCSIQNEQNEWVTIIRRFELPGGKEVASFPMNHNSHYFTLSYSPDGKTLACGMSNQSCLLDCSSGRILHRLPDRPHGLAFAADGKSLLGMTGNRLRVWDVATGRESHDGLGDFSTDRPLAVTTDGRRLASVDRVGRTVTLWDTTGGRRLRSLALQGDHQDTRDLAFSRDGQTLVAARSTGLLQYWDVATGQERQQVHLRGPDGIKLSNVPINRFYVSPGGQHVTTLALHAGQGLSTQLALWQTATGKRLRQQILAEFVQDAVWSADGTTLAVAQQEGLTLQEAHTGAMWFRAPGVLQQGTLTGSPDGQLLAARQAPAQDAARPVVVWERRTGKRITTVAAGMVNGLALAPDNRSLVSTDKDFLRVWDLATGQERRRWPLHEEGAHGGPTALLLAAEGRRAYTVLVDGTVLVWDLSPALHATPLARAVGSRELANWWSDLANADTNRAYAALWRLAERPPAQVVAFLRPHLKPVAAADLKETQRLIKELHSEAFAVRVQAFKQLEDLGEIALPLLRQALEKELPLEVRRRLEQLVARPPALLRTPEVLRRLRAIQVLERLASDDARRLLSELAGGLAHASETREASAALQRLAGREDTFP
jgi:WD40 repeat protein